MKKVADLARWMFEKLTFEPIEKVPMPDCYMCKTNTQVRELGPDTMGHEYCCIPCRFYWVQQS